MTHRYRILGPLEGLDGERRLALGRPRQRAVLAVLLIHANAVVPVDRLMDLLWGDEATSRSVGALHAYVSDLRKLLTLSTTTP